MMSFSITGLIEAASLFVLAATFVTSYNQQKKIIKERKFWTNRTDFWKIRKFTLNTTLFY